MSTFYEFRQQISKLVKEQKHGEAIKYFKENGKPFSKEDVAGNEYLISDILTSLRKINEFDKALLFLKYLNIAIDNTTKQRIISAYGWVLYSKLKSEGLLNEVINHDPNDDLFNDDENFSMIEDNFSVDKSELITRIEELLPLIDKSNDFGYNLYSFLFLTVLKVEKRKPSTSWRFVSEFCDKINPEELHTDCRTIKVMRKGVEKDMELASDKEYWYSYKTKALYNIGEFQQCYDLSKKALDSFEKFHYSNDIWFSRRMALSKKQNSKPEETINELLAVLRKKKEWFIQKEIAELYFEINDTDNAFKYALMAISNFGDLEYKVDLIVLIGKILRAKGESELAYKHYYLSKFIRLKESWKVPQKLMDAIAELQLPPYPEDQLNSLKKELAQYWNSIGTGKSNSNRNTPHKTHGHGRKPIQNANMSKGRIEKILHNDQKGADGFIRTQDNKGIYFNLKPEWEIIKSLKVGLEVQFNVLPAKDGKKDRATNVRMSDNQNSRINNE